MIGWLAVDVVTLGLSCTHKQDNIKQEHKPRLLGGGLSSTYLMVDTLGQSCRMIRFWFLVRLDDSPRRRFTVDQSAWCVEL